MHQKKAYNVYFSNISIVCLNYFIYDFYLNFKVFFQCFHYFQKVAMETVRYLQSYNFSVPASRSFRILRFLAFILYMMLLVLLPAGVTPKISHFFGLCCYTIRIFFISETF